MAGVRSSRTGRSATAAVALVLGFIVATAWTQEGRRHRTVEGRRAELAALVAARQSRLDGLERDFARLRVDLSALTSRSADAGLLALQGEVDRLRAAAGLVPVHGPAVVVELADSPLARRGDPGSLDFRIQDVDLQAVVNELWAAGAEAVAVGGERIISTTAIRSAGGAVLVNYRVLTSPYRVAAIGDESAIRRALEASATARRFRRWGQVYRLGFRIDERSMTLPAFRGGLGFRYARPAPPGPGPRGTPAPDRKEG
ncbi:MAG: DUF881 domain-containing protein [Acidobacteria bacterium]|nr:DUF881 domain-containing protein [Acidobacteriota bacterium]